jgi:hypothetical protein
MRKTPTKKSSKNRRSKSGVPPCAVHLEAYGISAQVFADEGGTWRYSVHHDNAWDAGQPPIVWTVRESLKADGSVTDSSVQRKDLTVRDATLDEVTEIVRTNLLSHAIFRLRNLRWRREADIAEWLTIQTALLPILGETFEEETKFPRGFPPMPTIPAPTLKG